METRQVGRPERDEAAHKRRKIAVWKVGVTMRARAKQPGSLDPRILHRELEQPQGEWHSPDGVEPLVLSWQEKQFVVDYAYNHGAEHWRLI